MTIQIKTLVSVGAGVVAGGLIYRAVWNHTMERDFVALRASIHEFYHNKYAPRTSDIEEPTSEEVNETYATLMRASEVEVLKPVEGALSVGTYTRYHSDKEPRTEKVEPAVDTSEETFVTEEEFFDLYEPFETRTLHYFSENQVLCNENVEPIQAQDFSQEFVMSLAEATDTILYFVNPKISIKFEVIINEGPYDPIDADIDEG